MIPAPPGKTYLPYQIAGINYALGARGTLIADEMGLGKTVQGIGFLNALPQYSKALIVCPAGLRLNWLEEISQWRVPNAPHCTVVSYHQAQSVSPGDYPIVVVDEIHYCKNPESDRTQAMLQLTAPAKRVLGLTGTPILNRPIELWPILQMVCPEKWDNPIHNLGIITQDKKDSHPGQGANFWNFAARYCDLKMTTKKAGRYYKKAWDYSGASNLDELRTKLRSTCMVRRLKSEVLKELPPKRRQVIVLESDCNDLDIFPTEITEANYYEIIAKLRTDKVLFEEWSKRRHEQGLKKVDKALRFIGDALDASHKIIVFAHHADVIEKLYMGIGCEFHNDAGYAVCITGKVPMASRQESVKMFQEDPDCRVIVGSIGAMGVGFTLTAASHEIFVELSPVPGEMNQAEDRAHRITQKDSLLVQLLVSDKSIDARLAKILVKKQEVITEALDGQGLDNFERWAQ